MHKNIHQVPSGTKVPRLDMCRSIISLSKTAYQMGHNHPFSQRSKITERAVGGVDVRGNKKGGEGDGQNLKKRVGNIGGLNKIGGLGPLCQLCLTTFKHKMKHYYLNDLSHPNLWNIGGFDYVLAIIKNLLISTFFVCC